MKEATKAEFKTTHMMIVSDFATMEYQLFFMTEDAEEGFFSP